ncbi:MAG: DUF6152 family protein [Candidatus Competibacterales bacterium]|nr:DUF6152 family protein [Candidatus Competibacterales bacterium]
MLTRRGFGLGLLFAVLVGSQALAHHGWRWTEEGKFELTGLITSVRLGNPHGELRVDAEGEEWLVEVGQPWRNERAGLSDELLTEGTEITVFGGRSADPAEKRVKATSVRIDGREYVLYPNRD